MCSLNFNKFWDVVVIIDTPIGVTVYGFLAEILLSVGKYSTETTLEAAACRWYSPQGFVKLDLYIGVISLISIFYKCPLIMRDVHYGWLIRYLHANVASFFFIFVYLHIGRGLYYGSYRSPRVLLWSIGVIILVLMMAILVAKLS